MIGSNVSVNSPARQKNAADTLVTSFEMTVDSPRGEFSCVMAQDP